MFLFVMSKTVVGIIFFGIIGLVLEDVLRGAFYDSLCSINAFGCVIGWIAYKLPLFIIFGFLIWKIYESSKE